jgi:uncharacterized protein (DUF2384 family)
MSVASEVGLPVDDAIVLCNSNKVALRLLPCDVLARVAPLGQLHAGMRNLDVATPHFTDRVAEAHQRVASPDHSPALADGDRDLLRDTSG